MTMTENPGVGGSGGGAPEREFHPLANLFPLLTGAAFDDLVADIKANGLREPILLDRRGRILDGRNRYRACRAAGVEPRYVTWEGEGGEAELVLSLNLHRRHLNESQRAMVAARLAKVLGTDANKRRGRKTELGVNLRPIPSGKSAHQAAAIVNVSPRSVNFASKILDAGCEELIAAVESNLVAVSTARFLAELPKDEQAKVVAGGATEMAAKIRQLRNDTPDTAAKHSAGRFGILYQTALQSELGEVAGAEPVAFLWVASRAVPAAIAALQSRGFEYAPPE